ncbi:MAG: trypsin-like peptidase domain-containing protein [Sedimentisphaerales bacterium]|nr:trypsin-like peptidase domain-containing protein [Sedimentisphaerales bacterium]
MTPIPEKDNCSRQHRRPTSSNLLLSVAFLLALTVLGALSLRQHRQIECLRQQNQRKISEQLRTTNLMVDYLSTLQQNLAARMKQEISRNQSDPAALADPLDDTELLQIQTGLKHLTERVGQLANHINQPAENNKTEQLTSRLSQLTKQLEQSQARFDLIMHQQSWAEDIVSTCSPGVCLIQGEYMFVDPQTELPLRYLANEIDPTTLELSPQDQQLEQQLEQQTPENSSLPVSVTGSGPLLKVQYTASGFLVHHQGYILTNKHVTQPWEISSEYSHVIQAGYQGRLSIFRAYFPDCKFPVDLQVRLISENQDVALLKAEFIDGHVPVLPCAIERESLKAGQSVIVLGYPTGFDMLLARLGQDQLGEVLGTGGVCLDTMAQNLSERGLIEPIGTRGMCGRVNLDKIVYDAQTAIGGSGGPVIGPNGKVVGINTALLRGFSGTNFGIPIEYGLELLKKVIPKEADPPHQVDLAQSTQLPQGM